MKDLLAANLLSYSIQTALLLAAGGLALSLFRVRSPHWRLWCWQALLTACLLLPALEPWQAPPADESITIAMRPRNTARSRLQSAWSPPDLTGAALAIWPSGAAIRLGLFALGLVRLRRYRRGAIPRPAFAAEAQRRLGTNALIAVSEEAPGPATFGFFRPVVLLPARWAASEAVLYHELLHVRRGDWLFIAAEELLRAAFWFHPLIWHAIAQIQLAREEVVDREAVRLTESREQYLETLLAIAAAKSGLNPGLAPAPLFLKKRHLRNRVASLLSEGKMSRIRLSTSLAGLLALALAASWVGVNAFPLRAAPQNDSTQRIRVGGNVQALKLKKKVTPVYPPAAKEAHIQGTVTLTAVIDKEGKVRNLEVVSGPAELTESALTAVRQWEYETTLLNGEPVEVETQIDVRYTLLK